MDKMMIKTEKELSIQENINIINNNIIELEERIKTETLKIESQIKLIIKHLNIQPEIDRTDMVLIPGLGWMKTLKKENKEEEQNE